MAWTAFLGWFGKGMVPPILLVVGGLAHIMPEKLKFLGNKVGPFTVQKIVGTLSVVAAVAIWMKW